MKKFLLLLLSFVIILNLFADPVNPEQALKIAKNFYLQMSKDKGLSNVSLTLAFTSKSKDVSAAKGLNGQEIPVLYIFNVNQNDGFVIVSADDAVAPILGYNTTGFYSANNVPAPLMKLIDKYNREITDIILNDIKADNVIQLKWSSLENGEPLVTEKGVKSVNPLVTTTWGQSPYENALCPYDAAAGSSNNYHCVTGCPATAMAQIMNFWEYPSTGTGFPNYTHTTYGYLSSNLASHTYNWSAMTNNITSSNSAVATLMYDCGIAVKMNYGPTVSGSWVIEDNPDGPTYCSQYAFKTYFGYNASTIQGLKRVNYPNDTDWKNLLKNDLNAGRPIQYAGWGQGGHTFVCDGYDNNDFFHMNWGWGVSYASYNAFYNLDALNPGPGGTGAGGGTYNNYQQALIGIQPNSPPTDNLVAYSAITVNPNPIVYAQSFTVNVDISNDGAYTFNGDYTAAIFDDQGNFVDYIQTYTGQTLQSGYHYTGGLTFSSSGLTSATPGVYTIGIYFRPTGGNWSIIGSGSYSNYISINVISQPNDMKLYSNITVSTNPIYVNQAFTATTDIANYGSTDFSGSVSLDLHSLDGTWIQTIQEYSGQTLAAGFFLDNITFSCSGLNVAPGTYYLFAWDMPDGGSWEIVSADYYTNPVTITVATPPISPDVYEANNTEATAYNLSLSFSGNTATRNTNGSNIHNSGDLDYYQLNLATGYNYTITARVHDSYNSGNGNTYTGDMMFSYKYNSVWSDNYDDIMPSSITISNGGIVIFNVAPYFAGETGTYLLDMSITRTINTGINENETANLISVYPNPAQSILNIDFTNNTKKVSAGRVFDNIGKEISNLNLSDLSGNIYQIPVNDLSNGMYFISITSENNVITKKFTIQK